MDVIFATCEQQPLITPDDQLLADALRTRGIEVTAIPWTEIDPYSVIDAPPVLIRSTWDYHRTPTLFRSWLDAFADSGRRLWNPPAIAAGNVDKIYLQRLADAAIAIPKTRWIDRPDNTLIASIMHEERWDRAILKPRIGATAYGTLLIDHGTTLDEDSLAPARASGALLQEVVSEVVERGEISLIYFAAAFSHAVIKRAKAGEFRVQKDFGGRVEVTTPSPAVRSFADRIVATVPGDHLYARVDIVERGDRPLLMELELIEPELYFLYVPEAARTLAELIARNLGTAGTVEPMEPFS